MLQLVLFCSALILIIVGVLIVAKKKIKSEKAIDRLLLVSSILTILSHYSSLIYHIVEGGTAMPFLRSNPNLLLPIYPCNVLMWTCFVYGCMKNKQSTAAKLISGFIFWFGLVACLVGMFANVDFIRNPGFNDYDTVKSVFAHAFMLFNVLAFAVFGRVKVDLPKNMLSIVASLVGMFLIGCYCNLLFETVVSAETAYSVNSMYIIHSPFESMPFLRYPLIAVCILAVYFAVFCICELFAYKKGNRWISRLKHKTEN